MTVTSGLHIQEDKERETMVYVEKTAQKDRDAYQEMRGEGERNNTFCLRFVFLTETLVCMSHVGPPWQHQRKVKNTQNSNVTISTKLIGCSGDV